MVRVYTTRAKKSSVFLCFFIKIFSGFSIPRVVTVSIPVFSRVCGFFSRKRFSCFRNRFSRKFRSKNDHPVGFAGWSQGGFSIFSDFAGRCAGIRRKRAYQMLSVLISPHAVHQLFIPFLPASAALASCFPPPEAAPRPAARVHSTSSSCRSARFVFSPA